MDQYRGIQVYSEVGRLRKVLIHKPGQEIENLTPDLLGKLLFDDIPYLKVAREEHDAFADILAKNGAKPVYLLDAISEVLEDGAVKAKFLDEFIAESKIIGEGMQKSVRAYLDDFTDLKTLVSKLISGVYLSEIKNASVMSLADLVKRTHPFVIDPMPNLYFTRDPAAAIGSGYSINKMHTETRSRETLFTDYIFKYHSEYKGHYRFHDRDEQDTIEGGDILILSDKVVAIGISERTGIVAIEKIARRMFDSGEPFETVLAFNIPNRRAFMHLDTVFTMIDWNLFTIHPEIEAVLNVYSITQKDGKLHYDEESAPVADILKKHLEVDNVDLIRCGDGHPVTAAREQWNDGSNTLAISPREVVVYSRNHVTNKILEEAGVKLHTMPSSELSRGRGGPRCMSMPLYRDR